jgi:hypothetical protein
MNSELESNAKETSNDLIQGTIPAFAGLGKTMKGLS